MSNLTQSTFCLLLHDTSHWIGAIPVMISHTLCVCGWGRGVENLSVVIHMPATLFFETGSLSGLESTKARLSPGILLLPPEHQDYRCIPHAWVRMGAGVKLYPLSHHRLSSHRQSDLRCMMEGEGMGQPGMGKLDKSPFHPESL